jgi:hypothetical protein
MNFLIYLYKLMLINIILLAASKAEVLSLNTIFFSEISVRNHSPRPIDFYLTAQKNNYTDKE